MSLPPPCDERTRPSGHRTAKIAAAVIRPNKSHNAMAGVTSRAGIRRHAEDQNHESRWKLSLYSLLLVLGGNVGGSGEQTGVLRAEQLGAEHDRRIDLRLAQRTLGRWRHPQPFQQNLRAVVEIALQF